MGSSRLSFYLCACPFSSITNLNQIQRLVYYDRQICPYSKLYLILAQIQVLLILLFLTGSIPGSAFPPLSVDLLIWALFLRIFAGSNVGPAVPEGKSWHCQRTLLFLSLLKFKTKIAQFFMFFFSKCKEPKANLNSLEVKGDIIHKFFWISNSLMHFLLICNTYIKANFFLASENLLAVAKFICRFWIALDYNWILANIVSKINFFRNSCTWVFQFSRSKKFISGFLGLIVWRWHWYW